VINERDIMIKVRHPFLMSLHYAFESRDYIIFVMEYCPGGELFTYIKKQKRFD
jgi:serum/glucocorticoid-regulated kinase 2